VITTHWSRPGRTRGPLPKRAEPRAQPPHLHPGTLPVHRRSRTYLKGGDFEDSLQQILDEIVRQTPNNVEYTGDKTGQIGRDVGDFVVQLADTG